MPRQPVKLVGYSQASIVKAVVVEVGIMFVPVTWSELERVIAWSTVGV
jgi:hypothetical protein